MVIGRSKSFSAFANSWRLFSYLTSSFSNAIRTCRPENDQIRLIEYISKINIKLNIFQNNFVGLDGMNRMNRSTLQRDLPTALLLPQQPKLCLVPCPPYILMEDLVGGQKQQLFLAIGLYEVYSSALSYSSETSMRGNIPDMKLRISNLMRRCYCALLEHLLVRL